jgi:hypothetical protein
VTNLEGMALRQAVELLQKAAIKEGQSLFSMVSDHAEANPDRLFIDYIAEDEWWVADHLTDGIVNRIKEDLQDLGWKAPE